MRDPVSFTVPIELPPNVAPLPGGSWTALPWSDVPIALTVTFTPDHVLSVHLRYRSANDEPVSESTKTFVRVSVGVFSRRLFRLELKLTELSDPRELKKAAQDLRQAVERTLAEELRPGAKLNYIAAEQGLGLSASGSPPAWMIDAVARARDDRVSGG